MFIHGVTLVQSTTPRKLSSGTYSQKIVITAKAGIEVQIDVFTETKQLADDLRNQLLNAGAAHRNDVIVGTVSVSLHDIVKTEVQRREDGVKIVLEDNRGRSEWVHAFFA